MGKLESAGTLIGIAILTVMLSTDSRAAEYYTWVDENGVTNYSERMPPGYQAEHVTPEARFGYKYQRNNPTATAETPEEPVDEEAAASELDDAAIDEQIASERARIDAEIAAAKRSNCQIGKRNLAQLEAYARIRVKDDDGQERVLTDSEKATRINKAKQTIRENCTG